MNTVLTHLIKADSFSELVKYCPNPELPSPEIPKLSSGRRKTRMAAEMYRETLNTA